MRTFFNTATLSIFIFFSSVVFAETVSGRVVGVSDGDTLTVLTAANQQVKVRLAGIDAPEKAQDFGQVAKKSLSDMVFGQQVRVEVQSTDRYGRTVGWVSQGQNDINAAQVFRGMAWVYRQYIDANSPYGKALIRLEATAQQNRSGLWGGYNPIPPWDFRRASAK